MVKWKFGWVCQTLVFLLNARSILERREVGLEAPFSRQKKRTLGSVAERPTGKNKIEVDEQRRGVLG